MSLQNFVSYANAEQLMKAIADKLHELNGAYILKGSTTFANLPSVLTKSMTGFVYNVTDAFTTDARFLEGAGKKYGPGANVAITDQSTYTEVTPAGTENPSQEGWYELVEGAYVLSEDTTVNSEKTYYQYNESILFDVIADFIDVDKIYEDLEALLTGEFDEAVDYSTGDVVTHENGLYKFKVDHAAGTWDAAEVDEVTIVSLINSAEPSSLTTEQINALLALL